MAFFDILRCLLDHAIAVQAARNAYPSSGGVVSPALAPLRPQLPAENDFERFCDTLSSEHIYMAAAITFAGRDKIRTGFTIADHLAHVQRRCESKADVIRDMLSIPSHDAIDLRTF